MRKTVLGSLALAVGLAALPAAARERGEDELRRDMEFAREQVYPALVNISVVVKGHSGGRLERFPAAGSGVIVSPGGHVVTNFHVAGDTTRIVCRLPSQESIEAEVVAHDPLTDISVLRLKLESRRDRNLPIPFARIGNSDELTTGDYVLAMGNPFTLSSSMTLGIVSNPRRVFASFTGADMDELDLGEGQMTGLFTRWIQHDALILPGNSGGPLVNLKGEVVGINELGGAGMGFAIPSNLVSWVVNQALAYGDVRRGWIGVELMPTERSGDPEGALVTFVQPGGTAEAAGLKAGDRILALGGEAVHALHWEQIPPLYAQISRLDPGSEVRVAYRRGTERHEATVRVAKMEKYLADEQEERRLGLTLRDITGPMALLRRYPDEKGVLVTGVRPGHPADAARPPLESGDVIREADGKPVEDAAAFTAIVAAIAKGTTFPVRVRRGDEEVITVLASDREKPPRPGGELPKPWLGLRTQVLTPDVAGALRLGDRKGFRVTQVYAGTEAARAGLQVGDVIVALDGEALRASRAQDAELLVRRIERLTVGATATLTVFREGGERSVPVVLEAAPIGAAGVPRATDELLEFSVRDLTFDDRVENRWSAEQRGVIVTDVTSGGWAQLAGLQADDLILALNGREITSVAAFEAEVVHIQETKPRPVPVFLRRAYRTKFLFLEPEYPASR